MRTYKEFKPHLTESNRVGSIPKLRKNLLSFTMVALLFTGTVAGSLAYTKYTNEKIMTEFSEISHVVSENNSLISANLEKINELIKSYDESEQEALISMIDTLQIEPIKVLTVDEALSKNQEIAQQYEEAQEIIKNSPFRLSTPVQKEKEQSEWVYGIQQTSEAYKEYEEALKAPKPAYFKKDILRQYKPLADEGLALSYLNADKSRFVVARLELSQGYISDYQEYYDQIKNVMTSDGYSEKDINSVLNKFKSSLNVNRAFKPNLDPKSDNKLMEENAVILANNYESVMTYLDEQRPKITPKVEEKPAEAPKAVEKPAEAPKAVEKPVEAPKAVEKPAEAPKAVEKPKQQPRQQQRSSVPKW